MDNDGVRRLSTLPTILALILASIMAPYQHVHLHSSGEHASEAHSHHHDHEDDAAVVHIHFYSFAVPIQESGKSVLGDLHSGHVSIPLDTFATLSHVAVPAIVEPPSQMLLVPPQEAIAEIVRVAEPRAHDAPIWIFPRLAPLLLSSTLR